MLELVCGIALQVYSTHVRAPAPPRDDPSSVSVIELGLPGQRNAPTAQKVSLAEVLVGQPGVQVRRSGTLGQWSGALLRGADSAQVAVLLDGIPLSRGVQAAVDLSQIPVDGAERVEVYRGVPPIELGIDAVGGAINLISRRGAGDSLWALLGSGSFGLRKVSAGHSSERNGVRAAATLNYQGATGDFPYLSNAGLRGQLFELIRRNDGFDQLAADVRVSGDAARGSYFVGAQGLFRRQGIPSIGQAEAQPGQPMLDLGRAIVSGGGKAELLSGRLELTVDGHTLLERSSLRDLDRLPPARAEQLSAQSGARTVLRLHSEKPEFTKPPQRTLILLGELRYEHFGSSDLCPAPRRDCAGVVPTESERLRGVFGVGGEVHLFGNGKLPDRLLVQSGAHVLLSRSRLRPIAGSPDGTEPIVGNEVFLAPRLAARLKATRGLLFRLSGGRFVRLPTFLELFGDGAFYRPSLGLRPESSWLIEGGGRFDFTTHKPRHALQLSVEAHGFARVIDDLIVTVRNGPTLLAENVGKALTAGLELSSRIGLGELLLLQVNYSFLEAKNQTNLSGRNGNLLPGRPPHSVFARLDAGYRLMRVGYELDYTSLLYLDPANQLPRPARALHALLVQLGPYGAARLNLAIEVRNLADTRAVPVPTPLGGASGAAEQLVPLNDIFDYPLPGRALYATLSGRL